MLNFYRSTVKHGTQNIQNDATSGFLTALECTKFVFGRRSAPGPTGGAYSALPDRPAGLRGHTSKGREAEGKEKEREKGEWKGTGGTGPPFANSWIRPGAPVFSCMYIRFLCVPNKDQSSKQYSLFYFISFLILCVLFCFY